MKILTFDIEEWFHILDHADTRTEAEWSQYESRIERNIESILGILAARQQQATFFCLGWIARHYPQVIRRIADHGYEIGTHSDRHQLAYEQSPEEFRRDLDTSIKVLEDVSGQRVRAYRAPGFSLKKENKWAFDVLLEQGIEIDCSIFPASRAHGGFAEFGAERPARVQVNGGVLKEFPMNTVSVLGRCIVFSGGGYFRLLPYNIIRQFARRSDYVMTYFHPRDIDTDQPVIENLSLTRRFKSYYGIKGCQNKLEKLIDEFDFVSLDEAENNIEWSECSLINI